VAGMQMGLGRDWIGASALVLWERTDKDASPCDWAGGGGNRRMVSSNKPSAT
jgi:hypothetical protein